jgi:5'-nucleotidase
MRILITNDDGVEAEGIKALVKEFEVDNEVFVVAPDQQRSAAGHSITISRPIIVSEVKLDNIKSKAFSIDGTPADCVRIGAGILLKEKFDVVLSGINCGTNLGSDVIYSGTVSAAIEGSIYKIPSFAVSMEASGGEKEYKIAAKYAREIIFLALDNNIGSEVILNINVPSLPEIEIKGISVSSLGNRIYDNSYIKILYDNGGIGYKINGSLVDNDIEDTDVYNFNRGYVTVTPLHYDLTNFKLLKKVDLWFKKS